MTNDGTIARLAAANPLPDGAVLDDATRERLRARALTQAPVRRRPSRRLVAVALATTAIGVPAAAFADQIGGFLGISNQGTPVATTDVVGADGALESAMSDLHFPSQVAELGERAGFHFYVTRNAGGDFCFAISAAGAADAEHPKVIGCGGEGTFPSAKVPVLDFSTGLPNGGLDRHLSRSPVPRLLGFATDDVATVAVLDASGDTIASTPVVGNLYAETGLPQVPASALVALDSSGNELFRIQ
ncbi:MAG TPA: hypothetical protein VLN26_00205 [Gaiellaceae bacterium]|nr:hypothetical protein [Gaiellaceae bacterium]